jgi:hypothetical protein
MVTCVILGGTVKLSAVSVTLNFWLPPHALDAPHAHVAPEGQFCVQSVHTPPVPQAEFPLPSAQVPPEEAEQQPLLQSWVVEHAVVHVPLVASHASLTGQSLASAHPQAPAARHWVPASLSAQEPHIAPRAPHAVCSFPVVHTPALQQPPLQAWLPEQMVVHAPVEKSHASPEGQSVADAQPASVAASAGIPRTSSDPSRIPPREPASTAASG